VPLVAAAGFGVAPFFATAFFGFGVPVMGGGAPFEAERFGWLRVGVVTVLLGAGGFSAGTRIVESVEEEANPLFSTFLLLLLLWLPLLVARGSGGAPSVELLLAADPLVVVDESDDADEAELASLESVSRSLSRSMLWGG
jgi:hypothetical protein